MSQELDQVKSFQQMVQTLESQMEGIDKRLKHYHELLLNYSENVFISGELIDQLKKTVWYDKIFKADLAGKLKKQLNDVSIIRNVFDIQPGYLERLPAYTRHLHAAIGCVTESAELLQGLVQAVYSNKPIDKTNIIEELGDQLFYIQMMANIIGVDLYEIMRINQAKLAKRYGDKFQFTSEAAINRNHAQERVVMENEHQPKPATT